MTPQSFELPKNLPRPLDDGAASHLEGMNLPNLSLPSTDGSRVPLASLPGTVAIYVYPMTGCPGIPLPDGWDAIPGARGCSPQSCNFKDRFGELKALRTAIFGLSVQDSAYQREARDRLQLPFEILSDAALELKGALRLPTFNVAGMELYKRLTLVVEDGRIKKVFYPVFPPDQSADEVLAYLHP